MGQPAEVAQLIKQGMHPTEIAKKLRCNPSTVNQYIAVAVVGLLIDFVDVLLVLRPEDRESYERELDAGATLSKEAATIQKYERFAIAEIYSQIREIERKLHTDVRSALVAEFGDDDRGWWRQGVQKSIRQKCADRRESDDFGEDHHPFSYTMFDDLEKIVEDKWKLLQTGISYLAPIKRKEEFVAEMKALHRIRNQVAHPIRIRIPSDVDIAFVRQFHKKIHGK